MRLSRKVVALAILGKKIIAVGGVRAEEFRAGLRRRDVVKARRLFCQVAVRGMGHSGAAVARFLGVTTSAANRLAASEQLPEVRKFLNAL